MKWCLMHVALEESMRYEHELEIEYMVETFFDVELGFTLEESETMFRRALSEPETKSSIEEAIKESFLDKSYSWKEILSKNGLLQAENEREARDFVVQFFLPYFTEGLASKK